MGSEEQGRFISAAPLIEEYLDTRIPEGLEHYRKLVALTEQVVKQAFSAEVVKPGVTRVGVRALLVVRRVGAAGCGNMLQAGAARAA
jgi:Xaa-Pro dipeptidase